MLQKISDELAGIYLFIYLFDEPSAAFASSFTGYHAHSKSHRSSVGAFSRFCHLLSATPMLYVFKTSQRQKNNNNTVLTHSNHCIVTAAATTGYKLHIKSIMAAISRKLQPVLDPGETAVGRLLLKVIVPDHIFVLSSRRRPKRELLSSLILFELELYFIYRISSSLGGSVGR